MVDLQLTLRLFGARRFLKDYCSRTLLSFLKRSSSNLDRAHNRGDKLVIGDFLQFNIIFGGPRLDRIILKQVGGSGRIR
jgi:hypothetical protein